MTNLILGDSYLILKTLAGDSIDAVVTDPPYGLSFMNKHWDHDVPSVELWREVLRVLKPGGHVLSFGGTRTYHRMVVNIEDAGFEIRDQIQWIYGSGFPKSHNLNGEWQGWGTALKPANEPIVLARKPLIGTVAKNVEAWGTSALNIDGCRIDLKPGETTHGSGRSQSNNPNTGYGDMGEKRVGAPNIHTTQGRWPANVLFDEEAASVLDKQSGNRPGMSGGGKHKDDAKSGMFGKIDGNASHIRNDSGGASRFFFVVKGDPWQDQKDLEIVKLVANNSGCDEALLNTVLKAVRTNCKSDRQLLLSLDSIPDFKKCILIQDLASLAVEPESIGITEITQSLLRLFGSVHHAIDESINSENQNLNSVPTRFLYQPKASKRERGDGNHHPTVKPIKLMEYLVRLVTPPGGTVLDPFMGSGTTGIAAKNLGFGFVGIERSEEYFEIAKRRI